LRPQLTNSASFARLAETLSIAASDEMTFLEDASSVVNDILLQGGNATEHLTDADQELLEKVKTVIQESMYGNMRSVQESDKEDLQALLDHISACNAGIKARQSSTGDLGLIHQEAVQMQEHLTWLQGEMDEKTRDNETLWGKFDDYMQTGIGEAPRCPDFPTPRGMAQLDVYFEKSDYSVWWIMRQKPYHDHRNRFDAADKALRKAIAAYNIRAAELQVKYCDYKNELEEACESHEDCYASRVHAYNEKVAGVKIRVAKNLEIVKAAETLLAQVRFLLAQQKDRETREYSTSEWKITYHAVPEKTLCNLSTLTASTWNPPISCEPEEPVSERPNRHGKNCGKPCKQWEKRGVACDWCGLHEGKEQFCCRDGWDNPGCEKAVGSHKRFHSCVTVRGEPEEPVSEHPNRHGENCGKPCKQWEKRGVACDWCGLHKGKEQFCCRDGWDNPGCEKAVHPHKRFHSCVTVRE